jgi:hypothetical protein
VRPRRRPPTAAAPKVPGRLRECFVEDWVPPGEPMPQWAVDGEEPWAFWASIAANRRWRKALYAWFDEQGISRREGSQLVPSHRPRWRNPPWEGN